MAAHDSTLPAMHSRSPNGTPLYEKVCPSCGKVSIIDKRKLGKLCIACANKARSTHGLAARGAIHPLYRILKGMEERCRNPNNAYYYGKGVSVCREWVGNPQLFVAWALANGWERGLEIDRRDGSGDYRPDNCQIVTHQVNSQHTSRIKTTPDEVRRVKKLLNQGVSIKAAAADVGVSYMVVWHIKKDSSVWGNV